MESGITNRIWEIENIFPLLEKKERLKGQLKIHHVQTVPLAF